MAEYLKKGKRWSQKVSSEMLCTPPPLPLIEQCRYDPCLLWALCFLFSSTLENVWSFLLFYVRLSRNFAHTFSMMACQSLYIYKNLAGVQEKGPVFIRGHRHLILRQNVKRPSQSPQRTQIMTFYPITTGPVWGPPDSTSVTDRDLLLFHYHE